MVLKEKEDLCNWFKLLHPRKRIDYMCGLLHLCLPLELRFIGTVLEDIAKKDFSYLRDAENKANNPSELTNDESQSIGDPQFRAKIQVHLALMHSADSSCADIIFRILEKQFCSLTNYSQDDKVIEEILTILTLACHHPAFKFQQRLQIGEVLKATQDNCRSHWGNQDNPTHLHLPKTCQAHASVNPSNRSQKGITSICVKNIRDEHAKNGPTYELHTTWSNGDITQSFMKHKDLHNLHNQIFNRFQDEKKLQNLFPGSKRGKPREEKIASMNTYLSQLSKAQHILTCDIVTQAFHSGKPMPMLSAGSPLICSTYYMHENRCYSHYPDGFRVPYFAPPSPMNMVNVPATNMSSSTSPANSRSSSPNIMVNNNKNIKSGTGTVPVAEKGPNHNYKAISGLAQQQTTADQEQSVCQLLSLLGLEKYSENLASHSLEQLCKMSSEDLTRLGLPSDAQMKLQSSINQQKPSLQDVNGLIQFHGSVSKQERLLHSSPAWQGQCHLSRDLSQQPQSNYLPLQLISHHTAIQSHPPSIGENSPSVSGHCTPSLSPGLHSMTDSPPSSLASPTIGNLEEKNLKSHQVDSSGSEDDKMTALYDLPVSMCFLINRPNYCRVGSGGPIAEGTETATYRNRGPGRPQQSMSLPLLNHTSTSGIVEKMKVTALSAPKVNNDITRDSGTPPMVPVSILPLVNGFDSPFMSPNAHYASHHQPQQQHQQQHRYKGAQPTHTGMQNNVVNMPCPNAVSQPPPPAPSISKNNGGIKPSLHQMLHPHYIMPPNMQANIHPPQLSNSGPPHPLPAGQPLLPPSMAPDNGSNIASTPFMSTIVPATNFISPHSRNILTTMSNSTGVISTIHPSGQQHPIAASHSPSPVATSVPTDQTQVSYNSNSDVMEESSHKNKASPPSHNNNNSPMSHISSKTGPGSATPSPPLAPKQVVTCITCDSSNHHQPMYVSPVIMNIMPPFSNPHQQNSLQHFPNGITEPYLTQLRYPMYPHQPMYYGSQTYNHPPVHHHPNNSNTPSHLTAGTNSGNASSNGNGGKSSCYNCGQSGHKGNECKENPMDSMTNSFRLNFKPKSDSE